MKRDLTINIGNLKLDNNIFLAPLAGVTDMSFRLLCKEMGAGLVVTEMISAKGVHYNSKNSIELAKLAEGEKPASVQIFGCEPDLMAEAAKLFEQMGAAIIDINIGCPTPKITANKSGSFLMTDPVLVGQIVEEVAKAVSIPVTVKIRKGYKTGNINAPLIAKIAEESGAKAVTIHGRFADEFYRGKCDRSVIKTVKESVKIPVIGNGDIVTPQDAKSMLEETNCDAIMIGRGALGYPWIFRDILSYLKDGIMPKPPSTEEIVDTIKRQIEMTVSEKGEYTGVREMRKHVAWYIKGHKGSAAIRDKVFKCEDKLSLINTINAYFENLI